MRRSSAEPIRADLLRRADGLSLFELLDCCWTSGSGAMASKSARREDDSALNPRHSWFFVKRVRQQQNGSAEEQCVEETVERNHVFGRGQEHRQVAT
jgi:hypothetical protein